MCPSTSISPTKVDTPLTFKVAALTFPETSIEALRSISEAKVDKPTTSKVLATLTSSRCAYPFRYKSLHCLALLPRSYCPSI